METEKKIKSIIARVKGRLYDTDLLDEVLDNIDDDDLSLVISWLESDESLSGKMLRVLTALEDEFCYRAIRYE